MANLGNLTGATSGDGDLTSAAYDNYRRVTTLGRSFTTSPPTTSHTLSYATTSGHESGENLATSVTPNGLGARTYVYDDFGQIVESNSSEFGTNRWFYLKGRLTSTLNPTNLELRFLYDRMGRVTKIDQDYTNVTPSFLEQDYEFVYDIGGSLPICPPGEMCAYRQGQLAKVRIEYAPGSFWEMDYNYNAFGAVTYEKQVDGKIARYSYDSAGRLFESINPAANQKIRYDYSTTRPWQLIAQREVDAAGTTTLVNWVKGITYDAAGAMQQYRTHDQVLAGLGSSNLHTYLSDGQMLAQIHLRAFGGSVATALDRDYGYAADGLNNSIVSFDTLPRDPSQTFFFDKANRLLCQLAGTSSGSSCNPGTNIWVRDSYTLNNTDARNGKAGELGAETYVVDATGTLTSATNGANTRRYYYNNRKQRSYDTNNNLYARNYTYDTFGRLRTITGAVSANILYDNLGRPIQTTTVGGTTKVNSYYYNQAGELWGWILNETGGVCPPTCGTPEVHQYVRVSPTQIGEKKTFSTTTYLYHQTTPTGLPVSGYTFSRTLANDTNEVYRNQWTPYGQLVSAVDTDTPPFRALGQIELAGSNYGVRSPLYLNSWRTYDPQVGSYLQPEPLLIDGSLVMPNAWGYANANPVNNVDLDGRHVEGLAFSEQVRDAWQGASADSSQIRPILRDVGGGAAAAEMARRSVPWGQVAQGMARFGLVALRFVAVAATVIFSIGDSAPMCTDPATAAPPGAAQALASGRGRRPQRNIYVCRGGLCRRSNFINGHGTTIDEQGCLQGASVGLGFTAAMACRYEPHGQVGVTTVGTIIAAGGEVLWTPSTSRPNHGTMSGITPEQAEMIFSPTRPNVYHIP